MLLLFIFFGYFLNEKKSKEWFSIIYNKKRKIYLIIKTIFVFIFLLKYKIRYFQIIIFSCFLLFSLFRSYFNK